MTRTLKVAVSVDFTESSDHALEFATTMFSETQPLDVSFLVVTAFKAMIPFTKTPAFPAANNEELEKKLREKLDETIDGLKGIEAEGVFMRGSAPDVLKALDKERSIDLVVMGTSSKSSLERQTFGSNTLEMADELTCPVLAVPLEAKVGPLHHVVVATDLKSPSLDSGKRLWLQGMAESAGVRLTVLHVLPEGDETASEAHERQETLEKAMEGLDHDFELVKDNSVYRGMASYLEKAMPDLLMVMPRDRNFFQELFSPSVTDRIVAHGQVPVMIF